MFLNYQYQDFVLIDEKKNFWQTTNLRRYESICALQFIWKLSGLLLHIMIVFLGFPLWKYIKARGLWNLHLYYEHANTLISCWLMSHPWEGFFNGENCFSHFTKLYKFILFPTSLHTDKYFFPKTNTYLLCKDLKFGKIVNITETSLTWTIRTQTASIVVLFSFTIDICICRKNYTGL